MTSSSPKVALVTGAAKRLGREIALSLAREGYDLVVHFHHSSEQAARVTAEIISLGRRAQAIQADLSKVAEIKSLFATAQKQFGRLDVLINSASNFLHTEFSTTTEETWNAALDVNLRAAFFASQAAAPLLKQSRGCIINISDIGGQLGWTGYIPHCVSKAGLNLLTRALAKELAPEIRVNAVAPGTITLPGDPAQVAEDYSKRAPLRRTGSPADVTSAISYLINSAFITGQVLTIDGGRTL